MAKRLYLSSTPNTLLSPTFDGSWEVTGSAVRRLLDEEKGALALPGLPNNQVLYETLSAATTSNTPAQAVDVLIAQYTSPPLSGNQTISGTIKGQARFLESNTANDADVQCVIWVRTSAGAVRGTLVASNTTALANEFSTGLQNRSFPKGAPVTPTTVNALDTDRIIVEIGWRKRENATTNRSASMEGGAPSGTDLPEDNSTSTQGVPWIEFADNLVFAATYGRVSQVAVESLQQITNPMARMSQVSVEVLMTKTQPGAHGSSEFIWVGEADG